MNDSPNPIPEGFNWDAARACLQWCANIYPKPDGTENVPPYGGVVIKSATTDARAWVAETPTSIMVVFRGSKSPRDYIQDAKFALTKYPCGLVMARAHLGFTEDYKSLKDGISSTLLKLSGKPIFVGGHSLGGGEAIPCAVDLKTHGHRIAAVYTFGQPRVGDSAFRDAYNVILGKVTWRIVNENDIVPRVPGPPVTWFIPSTWPYRHCGTEVFLPVDGGYVMNPNAWQNGTSNISGLWQAFKDHEEVLVGDHHSDAYTKRIANLK